MFWCMECSHETGRLYAAMLFGTASSYPILLRILDKQDGLRRLFNTISTLKVLTHSENSAVNMMATDDEEFNQRQALRQCMMSFKRYLEGHLAAKCDELRGQGATTHRLVQSATKPIRSPSLQVIEEVTQLMQIMPFRYLRYVQAYFLGYELY